jgi:flavodoxin
MNSFKKRLVAYFSHSGNTREIARQIQEATGADAFEIVPVDPYPTDYNAVVAQAKQELRKDDRPVLKSNGPDLRTYDLIFLGSPNWWGTIVPPVKTFLSAHDLSGKTIVPFITHDGSGLEKSVQDVESLSPGATVLEGRPFWGRDATSARDDVRTWLRDIDLLK